MGWATAQNLLYFVGNLPPNYGFGYLNVETCDICIDFGVPYSQFDGAVSDVVPLPNGNVMTITSNGEVSIFNPPNPTPISTFDIGTTSGCGGAVLLPNGNIYISARIIAGGVNTNQLHEFNPNTNTSVLVGSETGSNFTMDDIFFWQGTLHTFGRNVDGDFSLMSVQVGNPLVFTPIYVYGGPCGNVPTATIATGSFAGIYTGAANDCSGSGTDVYFLDYATNTVTFQCEVLPNGYPYGLGEVPSGFPQPPASCACVTDAGEIPPQNAVLCPYENLIFSNTLGNLDPTDIKQFIIFSDFTEQTGSIVATSNTPNFSFAPPLQTGVTYFVAAIAGNAVGGNVDLNDPCLDISNIIEVLWRPVPTVSFSTAQTTICGGVCQDVAVNLTGTPPFTLTYSTPFGGQQSQIFTQNSGILQVCPPVGFLGALTIQAVGLVDANCVCN